jgi:hypothetical protein
LAVASSRGGFDGGDAAQRADRVDQEGIDRVQVRGGQRGQQVRRPRGRGGEPDLWVGGEFLGGRLEAAGLRGDPQQGLSSGAEQGEIDVGGQAYGPVLHQRVEAPAGGEGGDADAAAEGIGTVRDCMVSLDDYALLRAARSLSVRVRALIAAFGRTTVAQMNDLLDGPTLGRKCGA